MKINNYTLNRKNKLINENKVELLKTFFNILKKLLNSYKGVSGTITIGIKHICFGRFKNKIFIFYGFFTSASSSGVCGEIKNQYVIFFDNLRIIHSANIVLHKQATDYIENNFQNKPILKAINVLKDRPHVIENCKGLTFSDMVLLFIKANTHDINESAKSSAKKTYFRDKDPTEYQNKTQKPSKDTHDPD